MDLCCIEEDDPATLDSRLAVFCTDVSTGSVTGPRRMGREGLVMRAVGLMRASGKRVSLYPSDPVDDPDVLAFMHWKDIDESYVASHPDADVIYGQDLCHQVPAVVRIVKMQDRLRRPLPLWCASAMASPIS